MAVAGNSATPSSPPTGSSAAATVDGEQARGAGGHQRDYELDALTRLLLTSDERPRRLGLRIETGTIIGERVHPKSGRAMIYLAARPTHGTDVIVGDEEELAEVRWVSLAEADQLMGGMIFEPVREYLARELGEA
jgi:hypothetical protein